MTEPSRTTAGLRPEGRSDGITPHLPPFVDATGTTRRLQALVAIGHTQTGLASALGVDVGNLSSLLHGHTPRTRRTTAEAVDRLFSLLWMQPQAGKSADQSRAIAKAKRWVGPLGWDDIDDPQERPHRARPRRSAPSTVGVVADAGDGDDEVEAAEAEPPYIDEIAVERAITGEKVKLTYPERLHALTRLHRRRWSDRRIARTLHVDERTIARNRMKLGLPAWELHEQEREAESA